MAELIQQNDSLNTGREKINKGIEEAEQAQKVAAQSVNDSRYAKEISENTQRQLNQLVIEGDSSVEAAQARVDTTGEAHETLKKRIDSHELVVSKTTPPNTSFWFEDRGESGLEVSTGSGVNIANAIVSEDEIADKTKLWFDK